jgi:hypothetical protein
MKCDNNNCSPLSNSEIDFTFKKWHVKKNNIKKYNNCYAYATNDYKTNRTRKLYPGHNSGYEPKNKNFTCTELTKYILSDFPDAYKTPFNKPCSDKFYKIYMAIEPKRDFHIYKHDHDGYWSHKPGSLSVSRKDASGEKITNPAKADRKYKNFNYKKSCSFFCIPVHGNNDK